MASPNPKRDVRAVTREQGAPEPASAEGEPEGGTPSGPKLIAGRYAVESRIGAGAMGTVVLATDVVGGRRVALKRMDPRIAASPQARDRFIRGARVASTFTGRFIGRVFDSGLLEGGVPFVATEYLEGCSITSYVERRGAVSVKEAVKYLLQICEAVAEGHAAGVIHRELKPENLFLDLGADGAPSMKVLDFGISAVACGVESEGAVAESGAMRSSLLYMAPEQLRSAGGIDERADIWSIGAVGYTLVIGKGPFEATSELEICARVLNDPPSPIPSRIDLGGFEKVLLRCLEKDPEQRFANVAELALAIARFGSEGAQSAAERVWELLRSDETVRMAKPFLEEIDDGSPPDTMPLPDLTGGPDPYDADARYDRPYDDSAPLHGEQSDDTLVSRSTLEPISSLSAAPPRRGRASPEVVLLEAPELPQLDPAPKREGAPGADRSDSEQSTQRVKRPPAPRARSAQARAALAEAEPFAATRAGRSSWRRPLEIVLAASLFLGVVAVWLVRSRLVSLDSAETSVAMVGVAKRAVLAVRAGLAAGSARATGASSAGPRASSSAAVAATAPPSSAPASAAVSASAASSPGVRPPPVPPPGGWRYDKPAPDAIYDEVERTQGRRPPQTPPP